VKKRRRGLDRPMISFTGRVVGTPETVPSKSGGELLRIHLAGERCGEPERLGLHLEGLAAERLSGPGGWADGDLVAVKLLLISRTDLESLGDGRTLELMSEAVKYGNDVAVIREEVRAELLEALGLDEWPSEPAHVGDGLAEVDQTRTATRKETTC